MKKKQIKARGLDSLKDLLTARGTGGDQLPLEAQGPGSDMTKLFANREE